MHEIGICPNICCVPCLIKDNTDMCADMYLLLCDNDLHLQYMCEVIYTCVAHLAVYAHDAVWIIYLHEDGHAS